MADDATAARLDTPRQIVSKWRRRFHIQRLAGLEEQPHGGRPARFSPSVMVEKLALRSLTRCTTVWRLTERVAMDASQEIEEYPGDRGQVVPRSPGIRSWITNASKTLPESTSQHHCPSSMIPASLPFASLLFPCNLASFSLLFVLGRSYSNTLRRMTFSL